MEFDGRCPTIGEMASVSDDEWMQLPGIGPATLVTMHQVRQQASGEALTRRLTDAELVAERDRLRASLRSQNQQLRAIMAELRVRNLIPHQREQRRDSLSYVSWT